MAVTGAVVSHAGPSLGGVATGSLGPTLLEEWGDEITSQFSNEATLFQFLEEGASEEDWQGEYVVEPIHTGRNRAGGPGQETDDYPTPGNQTDRQLTIGTAFYRTRGQITSKAIKVAEKGDRSKVKALQREMNDGLRDLILEVGIDLYGTSWGLLGYAAGAFAVNALTMVSTLGAAAPAGARLAKMHGTRYLSGGVQQRLMIMSITEATGAIAATRGRCIVATRDSRVQFTADAAVAGTVAGDAIVRAPSNNAADNLANVANAANIAIAGLDQLCDDGTTIPASLDTNYFGIDRTALPVMNAYVRNLGGAELDEATLQDFFDAIADNSGEVPDGMMMHRSVRSRLVRQFTGDRRFVPLEYKGGFKGEVLSYNPGDGDIAVWVDRLCPYRTLFAVNRSYTKRYTLSPAHLVEYTGSALRQSGDAPVWNWAIELDTQMACTKPSSCGKLLDIASDPTYGNAAFMPEH